ncbi:MAG TPA: XrtA system polysaccharide chain length determinant [Candidatus Acidoferrales bacterium]|jgi:polysaccharide chain length determinant protein (PEP-CTERM system associated)|nr:XrtA system polysaccharide chain length determinant [Candidatus Acidoferrales bacterium]
MTQRELTPEDYIAMLRRRWLPIVILTVLGPVIAYGVSRVLPNRYKSQTLVLVEQQSVPSDFVKPVDTSDISERLASMQQQILSRSRLEPLIRQFGLYPDEINRKPMEVLIARFQKAIEVTPILPMAETRASNLPGFYINVTLNNPRTAQDVCTTITSMFIEENLHLRQQHSEDTTQFLGQQLTDAKAKLDEQDAKLAAFQSRNLGSLPDDEKSNLNLLTGLTSQLDAATQALARAQQDKSFAESMLTQQVAAWEASQGGGNPETMEQQLSALQNELARLEARYTEDHPDVIKAKNDVAALKKKIADAAAQKTPDSEKNQKPMVEPQQIAQLRAQIHTYDQVISERTREQDQIKQQIKVFQERIQSSPAVEQEYKALTRDYQTALEFYNDLLKKRDQSAMASDLERRQEGEQFRVLDPANLPDQPSFPNRPLFAAGGLVGGLALGLGLAFVLEMRDTSFRTERDVEFSLHLPVLAMIPAIDPLSVKKSKESVKLTAAGRGLGVGART